MTSLQPLATAPLADLSGWPSGVMPALAVFSGLAIVATGAIVKAFTRRTTHWIVAGAIGGIVLVAPLLWFIAGLMLGPIFGLQKAELPAGKSTADPADRPQTVHGRDLDYTVTVPAGWTVKRSFEAYDVVAVRKSIYVGVIAEEASGSTSEEIVELARNRIQDLDAEATFGEPAPLLLDGRHWLQFDAKCRVEGIRVAYRYDVYSGPEGTFQIIGWTSQNLFERDAPAMEAVMKTFTVPKPKP